MTDDTRSDSDAPTSVPWPTDEEIDAELRRHGIDPESSPFETPGVAGIPFGKDSEEARAIRRILEEDRERAEQAPARDAD